MVLDNNNNNNHEPEVADQDLTEQEKSEIKITQELTSCKEQLNIFKEKYLYLNAEFDNYKKRIERDRYSWIISSQANILTDLLAILDDFERAQEYKDKVPQECLKYFEGFELIGKSLQKFLKTQGVQEITDISSFDPVKHEAIMQVDSDIKSSGEIVAVLQKGYMLKDQVLRPARVSLAK